MFNRICIIIAILCICLVSIQAKKKKIIYPLEEQDLWLSLDFEYEIIKNLEIEASEELRYYKDYSVLKQSITDLGIAYKFTDFFKTGLFYRYRIMPEDNEYRHELHANFTFSYDLARFEFSDRIRLHIKFRENEETINNLRNKISCAYKVTNWFKPYISTELFYRFLYENGDRLAQCRYSIGSKFKVWDIHSVDVFFTREEEYNTEKAINSNILGIGYSLSL